MHEWDDFDRALTESLAELPPEEAVQAVTPWREAMHRIVLGLCLTCFTLNFLYLQYLLPAVGAAELYLGFRSLRRVNHWFHFAWILSCCKAVFVYSSTVAAATPLDLRLPTFLGILGGVLTLLLLLSLWQGLRQFAGAMAPPRWKDPALWAVVWFLVMIALALFWPQPGWIVFLVTLYAFYRIIRSLSAVSKRIDTWGYAFQAAPVKVSDGRALQLFLLSLLGLTAACAVISSHLPPQSEEIEQNFESSETTAIRAELLDLGFPEELLEQVLAEDLPRLSGAVACQSDSLEDYPLGNDSDRIHGSRTVALEYDDGSVQLVHFFSAQPSATVWRNHYSLRTNAAVSDAVCRLVYTQGGETRTALLTADDYQAESGISYFGDPYETYQTFFPAFSWPFGSEDRRCYVIASADQAANPKTTLEESLALSLSGPRYPYQAEDSPDWSFGTFFYYGDGSGLMYKADQEARTDKN